MEKWIKSAERLPEIDIEYLTWGAESGIMIMQFSAKQNEWIARWGTHYSCVIITHWMDLPREPKESGRSMV
ncbi:hypothetical protein AGMMS49944_16240 [Spirochaetia bacterium]|nr:hypothetical protein AGMMS49944_16240 [Spirochaetia bacterium]